MDYTKICTFLSYIIIIFFFSCKDPNEYRIDPEFSTYLKRFTDNADVHSRTFDIEGKGLIMEFATLKNNTAGLTHYENPIRIEFDRTYWNAISKSAGADPMKENLVFHELGHGLLKRKHLNSTLENGDWKSIMCGGDKVNERPWNINYKGMRRIYYIDELFNESTPAPNFSSNQLTIDTTGYIPNLKLSFDNERNVGWKIGDYPQYKTSLVNGRLRFESKIEELFLFYAKTRFDIQSEFSYELEIEYQPGELSAHYGILFGTLPAESSGNTAPIEYLTINDNYRMHIGNRSWYSFFTELTTNSIHSGGRNKLKVFKNGEMLYYFINNEYIYCSEIETKSSGFHYGFIVPPKGIVYLENFSINKPISSGVSSKTIQDQAVEYDFITVKSLDQNLIHK